MEYIFGTNNRDETLRTKGAEHTNLTGFCQTSQEYEDCTIQDSFLVVRKTKSDEDSEGNCYDWYVIDKHNRIIRDKATVIYNAMAEAYTEGVNEA